MKSVLKRTLILWIILFIGCEDKKKDDAELKGCIDPFACNYDPSAIVDDGSCQYPVDIYGNNYVDCDSNCINDTDGDGICDEENLTAYLFILCEGNFGAANASLWSVDLDDKESETQANVFESLTGSSLGDVANAMYIHNDQLYIINNNSHTLEVLDLGENITPIASVNLSTSSPRYMAFGNDKGYITTWYNGILVLDLNSNTVTDTISISGLPEDIVYNDGDLYVSVPMHSDWSTNDEILKINESSKSVVDTFNVVPGPGRLLISDNKLFIASTYFDLIWNSYSGTSTIELSSGTIQNNDYGMSSNYGSDLVEIDGSVYRATTTGIAPLNSDLSVDNNSAKGEFSGVYSVVVTSARIFFGVTDDYLAPDQVIVTDLEGNVLRTFEVGALPTDFAVYNK